MDQSIAHLNQVKCLAAAAVLLVVDASQPLLQLLSLLLAVVSRGTFFR